MSSKAFSTRIAGIFEIVTHPFVDNRGVFLNAFRTQDLSFTGVWRERPIAQVNLSQTNTVGAIRGLHLQAYPHGEAKLVRCLRGRVWDVAVDLRKDSETFGQWHSIELTPQNGKALFIPEGCAHGFQVLEPDSELLYLHSGEWVQTAETGVRWDDADLAIAWPLPPKELSARDRSLPLLSNILSSS